MKQLWQRVMLVFAFGVAVAGAVYFLNGLNDRMVLSVQSSAIENKPTVVLDAGHGGMDSGATSGPVRESELNLAIAKKTETMLTLMGYRVAMTREGDYLLTEESAKTVRAQKRSDLKNRLLLMSGTPGSVGVSIHQNHFSQSYVHGAQVFYGKAEGSRALAELLQQNIADYLQTDNKRKIKEADSSLYILNNNKVNPAVMVECGFLSNPTDAANLQEEQYQNKLAFLITVSLMQYEEKAAG